MSHEERKVGIRGRLRKAWNTTLQTAEAISVSPMEDINDRVERLEREVATMKADISGAPTRRVGAF